MTDTPDFPHIVSARFTDANLIVSLNDGREISSPISWYPALMRASEAERSNWRTSPFGIHWPVLDEDLSLDGILRGNRSRFRGRAKTEQRSSVLKPIDSQAQKWSFTRGNIIADNDDYPNDIMDRLHDEIAVAGDSR